ncbi:CPK27, partial [Symbiodinium natans]
MPRTTPRAFRSFAQGIRGLARAQAIADAGLPADVDVVALVRRIALTLAFPETFQKAIALMFEKLAEPHGFDDVHVLHVRHVPDLLAHWGIPEDQISIFWAQLRKQEAYFEHKVLPEYITLKDVEAVLLKVLRRVRDKYSTSKVSRDQFITQNHKKFDTEYSMMDSCGKGSFGECFWVSHRVSKIRRVCKRIPKEETTLPEEEVQSELEILKKLDHPNVLRVFEWFEEEFSFLLVVEAATGGDLRQLLTKARQDHFEDGEAKPNPGLDESLARELVEQALNGLAYVHSMSVIHRDIKPANMLLASADIQKPRLLLADFGVAEIFQECASAVVKGTVAYMAPEVFSNETAAVSDVWAMGVVAYELLASERPFNAENPMAMYAQLKLTNLNLEPVRRADASDAAVAFIQRLLVKEVSKRPLCREALGDAWFSGVEKQRSLSGRQARKARKSIANFAQMSFFSKAALNCVAAQLDTHKIENLAEAFSGYDADHDGRLSTAEFAAGLAEMGVEVDVIDQLVASIDMDCDGHINYTEFVAALLQVQGKLIDDVVFHAFQIFDLNGDGHISLDELRSMLSGGGPLSAVLPDGKTVEQALQDLDTSQDGVVSFDEFKAYLTKESQGTGQNKSPEDSIEVDVRQSLEVVLQQLASLVGRPEAELLKQARRLAHEHWITTVAELKQLNSADWPRLGLPLKLEQ